MHSQPASWCQGMSAIWEGARQDFLGALRFLAQVEMTWPEQRATGAVPGPVRHGRFLWMAVMAMEV